MFQQLLPAFRMTLLLTVITGLFYPGAVTAVCETIFPRQANGSLVERNGRPVGSALIGQSFTQARYFHGRPSAAGTNGYDPTASGGSNLGPTNPQLMDRMKTAAEAFHKENPEFHGSIPSDALTTSASGLDPDISVANARAQAARVAEARGLSAGQIEALIEAHTEERGLGFLGENRVNVLTLNLALDALPISRH